MKRSLFYSFITILLTALCIVSGTTYAYFSNKESINAEMINEELKLDVKLNNLEILENSVPTKTEDLKCGYNIYLKDDVLAIDNMLIAPEEDIDISFDIEVTNNTNVSIKFKNFYNYVEGYAYAYNLSLRIDNFNYNENYQKIPEYVIKTNEKLVCKCNIDTLSSGRINTMYAGIIPNIKIRYFTLCCNFKDDLPFVPKINHLYDDYYGIHKVEIPTEDIYFFNICENSPLNITSCDKYSPIVLEKINPDEDSFIKIEKANLYDLGEDDNYLSFKVSFKNLVVNTSMIHVDFRLPFYDMASNGVSYPYTDLKLSSQNINFITSLSLIIYNKQVVRYQNAGLNKDKFLNGTKDKDGFIEFLTLKFYFAE